MKGQSSLTPRVYVACLAAYNSGKLHGSWMDVEGLDTLNESIQGMLAASPEPHAEEWAIHDYEDFGSLRLSEYASLDHLVTMAEFIREHGELGAEDFAASLMEETGDLNQVPESLRYYIDFEAMGRDMALNGDVFTMEMGHRQVHVFWNH